MNTHDAFSRIQDFDLDVPPDLDLNDIAPMLSRLGHSSGAPPPSSTSAPNKELSFPWNLNMNSLAALSSLPAADHFTLLQSTATQLYTDHAGTIDSLSASIQPHLKGPLAPVLLILAISIMVSVLVSFIMSIVQMAILAGAVVYFFPSVLAAAGTSVPANVPTVPGAAAGKPVSRTPVAAFAGVLAASYAFSSIATMVVLASSAYAYLNHAALAAKSSNPVENNGRSSNNSYLRPDGRSSRRDESHSSMFRRISRHRDSF